MLDGQDRLSDKWRDYSGLQIVAGDLYGDVERSAPFEWRIARSTAEQAGRQARVGHDARRR